MPNGVNVNSCELLDIQPLMDFHLLEWMIHHPKMEADHPHHMKVGAFCEQESKCHHGIKQLPSRGLGAI